MKQFIVSIAKEAGKMALDFQSKAKISSKGPKNIVTEADIAIEKYLVQKIIERYPEHKIVGEEGNYAYDDADVWYIDPIDGTSNYAHLDPHFCISIAHAVKGEVKHACIFMPVFDELFFAEEGKGAELNGKKISVTKTSELKDAMVQVEISPLKDTIDNSLKIVRHFMLSADRVRDMGFCAGQLAYVAAGRSDALLKNSQHPWDIAAGMLLVKEAGGRVSGHDEKEIVLGDAKKRHNIVASNGLLHGAIIHELRSNLKDVDFKKLWW
ncbi:MAG: inositol monophosphatase [Candidatus Woesearchaeota archaeon]|nr:inositol monophosphatase [Candidatus Woesearchaeota archaeon]